MPKQSTLKKRIRELEQQLAQTSNKRNGRRTRKRRRRQNKCDKLDRLKPKPTPTPLYCNDSYDCCRSTIRERCYGSCCDDTCYGGYGRTPCYEGCDGYDYGCCLPGPYPWAAAPYPTFPPVSVLPYATVVATSYLPTF